MRENSKKSAKNILFFLVGMLLFFILGGCGQKGPLQRPAQTSGEFIAIHSSMDKPVAQVS